MNPQGLGNRGQGAGNPGARMGAGGGKNKLSSGID